MKTELKVKVDAAVAGTIEAGGQPSQLLLDVQTFLNQPEAVAPTSDQPAGEAANIFTDPKLVPAVQRLMSCGQQEAQRYVSIVTRSIAIMPEIEG